MAGYDDVDRTFVNFGTMATGRQDFARQWQMMEGTLQELEGQLDRLLGDWEGEARSAYWIARKNWDAASGRMATLLQSLGAVIEEGHENFKLTEKNNAQMFGEFFDGK
ncbi:WXG100 family type VII secretion target [Sphaerisporangium fuscum]|uniref:WXG100 family type VII secretion target n=1 Tax=Sphaerisporangium fuscum TaxID=2835868 RepID=UPI001BDC065D|nr:WXG100 family type VII secretion target [Sphaerisporangium fuscum]